MNTFQERNYTIYFAFQSPASSDVDPAEAVDEEGDEVRIPPSSASSILADPLEERKDSYGFPLSIFTNVSSVFLSTLIQYVCTVFRIPSILVMCQCWCFWLLKCGVYTNLSAKVDLLKQCCKGINYTCGCACCWIDCSPVLFNFHINSLRPYSRFVSVTTSRLLSVTISHALFIPFCRATCSIRTSRSATWT